MMQVMSSVLFLSDGWFNTKKKQNKVDASKLDITNFTLSKMLYTVCYCRSQALHLWSMSTFLQLMLSHWCSASTLTRTGSMFFPQKNTGKAPLAHLSHRHYRPLQTSQGQLQNYPIFQSITIHNDVSWFSEAELALHKIYCHHSGWWPF